MKDSTNPSPKHSTNPSPTGGKITNPTVPNTKLGERGSSTNPRKEDKGSGYKKTEQGCGGQRKGYGERGDGRTMTGGKEKGPAMKRGEKA